MHKYEMSVPTLEVRPCPSPSTWRRRPRGYSVVHTAPGLTWVSSLLATVRRCGTSWQVLMRAIPSMWPRAASVSLTTLLMVAPPNPGSEVLAAEFERAALGCTHTIR